MGPKNSSEGIFRSPKHKSEGLDDVETGLDLMILDTLDSMSPEEFVDYISSPIREDERAMAYEYLFELLEDNDRINAISDYAEKKGMMGNKVGYE